MKLRLVLCLVLLMGLSAFAQIPESYKTEMKRQVGTWIADNTKYMSDMETDDAYGLSWEYAMDDTALVGKIYGIKDGKKTGEYWQFFQFWDPEKQQVRIIQVNPYGTKGEGLITHVDESHYELTQTYINTDGSTFKTGHRTEIHADKEISVSFEIKDGDWIEERTYLWIKQKK